MKKLFTLTVILIMSGNLHSQSDALINYRNIFRKAEIAKQQNDIKTAIDCYLQLLKIIPEKPSLNYNIAKLYALKKDSNNAIKYFEKALALGYIINDDLDPAFDCIKKLAGYSNILRLIREMKKPIDNSETAFKIPEKDLLPEGITYDPVGNCFYVGSLWKCKILKITQDGKISDFIKEKQDGLRSVAGVHVDVTRRVLWAVSFVQNPWSKVAPDEVGWSVVFKYNLASGKLIKKYELGSTNKSHLFNDLVVLTNGDIFITDTFTGQIFIIANDKDTLEKFIEGDNFMYPNGITVDDNEKFLYVANSNGTFIIDISSRYVSQLAHPDDVALCDIDGMYFYDNSLVCVQNGINRICRFYLNTTKDSVTSVELIETQNPNFILPTTGCLSEDNFYYIANSQAYSIDKDGSIFSDENLKEVIILRAELKKYFHR